MTEQPGRWFAVRCVFETDYPSGRVDPVVTYEERVTLWLRPTIEDAVAAAQNEAVEYAAIARARYLNVAQAYNLATAPGDGHEVFSLLRSSLLPGEDYVARFFDTGAETRSHK